MANIAKDAKEYMMANINSKEFEDMDDEGYIEVSHNARDPHRNDVYLMILEDDGMRSSTACVALSAETARELRDHLNFLLGPRGTE